MTISVAIQDIDNLESYKIELMEFVRSKIRAVDVLEKNIKADMTFRVIESLKGAKREYFLRGMGFQFTIASK